MESPSQKLILLDIGRYSIFLFDILYLTLSVCTKYTPKFLKSQFNFLFWVIHLFLISQTLILLDISRYSIFLLDILYLTPSICTKCTPRFSKSWVNLLFWANRLFLIPHPNAYLVRYQ